MQSSVYIDNGTLRTVSVSTGLATIDFGAFPGKSDVSLAVTGQTGIDALTSIVQAWIVPATTIDHSVDEHILETIRVFAHTVVTGTGFTITARNDSEIFEPFPSSMVQDFRSNITGGARGGGNQVGYGGGRGTRIYGKWQVGWRWSNV